MAKKEVLVETTDPRLFQVLKDFIVKDRIGNYWISLRDLCGFLKLDVIAVNEYIDLHYWGLRRDAVPHFELPLMERTNAPRYISNGEDYQFSEYDKYCCTVFTTDALKFVLLNLIRYPGIKTDFDIAFANLVAETVFDCLRYAPRFDLLEG